MLKRTDYFDNFGKTFNVIYIEKKKKVNLMGDISISHESKSNSFEVWFKLAPLSISDIYLIYHKIPMILSIRFHVPSKYTVN